ncbi:MAG: iron ABC transporter substrate-binding protein [Candidatus Promineifilaceae bacterium]|nr:iron ABC transporter substrate-binding protein [Candidatus Promineifilaceae bacterium]
MNRLQYVYFIGLFVPMLLLAACQPAAGDAEEDQPSESTGQDADNGQLIIYSGRSESLVQPIIDQFAEATGIDVQVRYGSTMEMAGVLLEEGANSPADVFYAQDPGGLGALQSAGMLAPLPDDLLDKVPSRFVSTAGDWVGMSGRARTVVYNVDALSDPESELPQDIFDFVDPQWDGRIGWAPTNGSFQAMVTAMRTTWGDDKTSEWLQGIQANNPVVYPNNTPIVAGTAAGEVDVGFVNHYYLHRFLAEEGEDFPARNYFLPGGGPGSLIMVSGAGVLQSAENAENAEKFLSFLLSVPGQQYFASQTFEYPVIEGVAIAGGLPELEALDAVAIDIQPAELADIQGTQDLLLELGIID